MPNVVILYADDLGWGDLGCFGADDLQTPNIDRLCGTGVRLPQWYANSPVCSPSRAALLTGRYPANTGVETILGGARSTRGLPQLPTLAGELRERGYATGIFGKWHLGADPEYGPLRRGFDTHFGFRAGCVDYYSHIFYWGSGHPVHDLWQDEEEVWANGDYLTTVIAEHAASFIDQHPADPFFLYVPFNAPHYPLHAPEEYVARFAHLPPDRQMMAAMIAALDDGVGTVIRALEQNGLRDDTIVFFSSDNGPSIEERNWLNGEEISYTGGSAGGLRGYKGSLFEGGIRVPSMISWPARLPAGVDAAAFGAMIDVLPTVLHAVDGTTDRLPEVDGISLLHELERGESGPDRAIHWRYAGQHAVRRGRWKIILDGAESMRAPVVVDQGLFDLDRDPQENKNLRHKRSEVFQQGAAEIAAQTYRADIGGHESQLAAGGPALRNATL